MFFQFILILIIIIIAVLQKPIWINSNVVMLMLTTSLITAVFVGSAKFSFMQNKQPVQKIETMHSLNNVNESKKYGYIPDDIDTSKYKGSIDNECNSIYDSNQYRGLTKNNVTEDALARSSPSRWQKDYNVGYKSAYEKMYDQALIDGDNSVWWERERTSEF